MLNTYSVVSCKVGSYSAMTCEEPITQFLQNIVTIFEMKLTCMQYLFRYNLETTLIV